MKLPTPQDVLDFWFHPAQGESPDAPRRVWFRKNAMFDEAIRTRFGALVDAALDAGPVAMPADPRVSLAYIVLLDQFTRNIHRDTPRAFAGDALALRAARALVDRHADRTLAPFERWFAYMPFEHAESRPSQDRAVTLFTALAAEAPATQGALDYAIRHREVIARFGRFPHRNRILGRASTPEETAFLQTPGSSF
jgi:uncharacterized protein (DUF924 family)